MKLIYDITINPGSDFQKQFIEASMNAILESIKTEFESKHKENSFEFKERIFKD